MNKFSLVVKQKAFKVLEEYGMLKSCSTVVVGFSGGADSVCLLHLLNSCCNELNVNIVAAHVNHGIRGAEAKRDADFARTFCEKNNISFNLLDVDCPALAEKNGESLEECGRRIRYEFFNNLCDSYTRIATAHNSNDNAETILFNIIRGTGLKGACGIPPVRDNIIRPLILCSRDEIEGYCKENQLEYVTDSTNLSDDYTRNKIRHIIIPAMENINSGAVSNITSFGSKLKEAEEYLFLNSSELLQRARIDEVYYDADILLKADKAVTKQALITAFRDFSGKTVNSQKVDILYNLLLEKGRVQLYGEIHAEVLKNRFRFFKKTYAEKEKAVSVTEIPFEHSFFGYSVKISQYTKYSKKFNKKLLDNLADCDKIDGCLYLRTRCPGDKFTFYDRKVTKSLKKLFNEMKIPVEMRDEIPILCDDTGIVWVYGVGVNSRCRIEDTTGNIICLGGEDIDN